MKRISIILFAAILSLNLFATIPNGTTIYLDVSQHKCCYATYMFRSDDYGICKKMQPVAGYSGLYSFKLTRAIGNNLRFAGTNSAVQVNNGDEINRNIDDFGAWSTTCPGASTPYCIVTDEAGSCTWAAAPVATTDSPLKNAQITMAYNCTKHAFVAGVYAEFSSTPCGVKISSPAMADDKVFKKPQSPLSYTIADNIALGEMVSATIRVYSDVACTALIEEKTYSATATSQECSQTHDVSVCMGTTATLTASLEGDLYEWVSDDPNINGASTRSVKIPTDNLGKYTYSVKTYQINIIVENNLMAGGDFEEEGVGFSSDYQYVGKDVTANYGSHGQDIYTLTQDVSTFWRDFTPIQAHGGRYYGFFDAESKGYAWKAETNSSSGIHSQNNPQLMIIKGQTYYFSYWAAFPNKEESEYFTATPATLQFEIQYLDPKTGNKVIEKLGEPYTLSNDDHDWHQQFVVWTAPVTAGDVMIAVYDTVTTWQGNDFCLDDIMFQNISYSETNVAFTDVFEVTVHDCDLCQGAVATEENETAEVCIDELPYTWKWLPTPLSAAGEYEYVERNINGCDSVRHTLTLTTQDCGPCTVKIYRKWTDFLFIDNSASLYTAYQWYCNEQAIEGATAQYFRIGEPYKTTDAYYCLLTDSKGGTTKSCPATFDEAEASATLYPAGAGKTEVARRVYVVSPNFRLVVTLFDDGSTETEKQIRF